MSTDTREALAGLSSAAYEMRHATTDGDLRRAHEKFLAVAAAALATQPAQPSAHPPQCVECGGNVMWRCPSCGIASSEAASVAMRQPSAQGEAVAWKLVPVEPTPEMLTRGNEQWGPFVNTKSVYQAMLASAPAAPAQAVPLTDEQLEAIMADLNGSLTGPRGWGWKDVARAIERAHGIKAAP